MAIPGAVHNARMKRIPHITDTRTIISEDSPRAALAGEMAEAASTLRDCVTAAGYGFVTGGRSLDEYGAFAKDWLEKGGKLIIRQIAGSLGGTQYKSVKAAFVFWQRRLSPRPPFLCPSAYGTMKKNDRISLKGAAGHEDYIPKDKPPGSPDGRAP